jgi:hypothetical protein
VEEVIGLILQFVFEVVLQLFGSIGVDAATSSRHRTGKEEKEEAGCGWLVAFAVFGAICGGLSLLVAPNLLLPNVGLRIANLIAAPFLAGGLSYLVAKHVWTQRGWEPSHHFWRGFWFALAFGLVRFAYAHR